MAQRALTILQGATWTNGSKWVLGKAADSELVTHWGINNYKGAPTAMAWQIEVGNYTKRNEDGNRLLFNFKATAGTNDEGGTPSYFQVMLSTQSPSELGTSSEPSKTIQTWTLSGPIRAGDNAEISIYTDKSKAASLPAGKYWLYVEAIFWHELTAYQGTLKVKGTEIGAVYQYNSALPNGAPTTFSISDLSYKDGTLVAPNKTSINFSFSGAKKGEMNTIGGYQFWYAFSQSTTSPTSGYVASPSIIKVDVNKNVTSGTGSFTIPSAAGNNRGKYCHVKIVTKSGITDEQDVDSPLSSISHYFKINTLPKAPTITQKAYVIGSTQTNCVLNGLSGSDADISQKTFSFKYRVNGSTSNYIPYTDSNSGLNGIKISTSDLKQGSKKRYDIIANDSLEDGTEFTTIEVTRNIKPVVNSFIATPAPMTDGETGLDSNCSSSSLGLAQYFNLKYTTSKIASTLRLYVRDSSSTGEGTVLNFNSPFTLTDAAKIDRGKNYQIGLAMWDTYERSDIKWSGIYQRPYIPKLRSGVIFENTKNGNLLKDGDPTLYIGDQLWATWKDPVQPEGYAKSYSYVFSEASTNENFGTYKTEEYQKVKFVQNKLQSIVSHHENIGAISVNPGNYMRLGIKTVDIFGNSSITYFTTDDTGLVSKANVLKKVATPAFSERGIKAVTPVNFRPIDGNANLKFTFPGIKTDDNIQFKTKTYSLYTNSFSKREEKQFPFEEVEIAGNDYTITLTKEEFSNFFNLAEDKNRIYSDVDFYLYITDELGQNSQPIRYSLTIDYRCKPSFDNSLLEGTINILTGDKDNNGEKIYIPVDLLYNSESDKNLLNPGDKITFSFNPATDKNGKDDVKKYNLYLLQSDEKYNNTTTVELKNRKDEYLLVNSLNVTSWNNEKINIEYVSPAMTYNKFLSFFVEAVDGTGLVSEPLFLNTYAVGCRLEAPSYSIVEFKEGGNTGDDTVPYSFTLYCDDNGGSRFINSDLYPYSKYPNLTRQIEGYNDYPKATLTVSQRQQFDATPQPVISKQIQTTDIFSLYSDSFNFDATEKKNLPMRYFTIGLELKISPNITITPAAVEHLIFGASPTLAKRKNQIGINTNDFNTNDAFAVAAYDGKDQIRFISTGDHSFVFDLASGQVDGGIFSGGAWGNLGSIHVVPSVGFSFFEYIQNGNNCQFMVYGPTDLTDAGLITSVFDSTIDGEGTSQVVLYIADFNNVTDEAALKKNTLSITQSGANTLSIDTTDIKGQKYVYMGLITNGERHTIRITDVKLHA